MSEVIQVSSDWLALREAEDARARSRELAVAASRLLSEGPIAMHDLGSGTGSMMRWLAPLLPGPQTWILHDWNADLTAQAVGGAPPSDRDGAPVSIEARTGGLDLLDASDLTGASLVTASALLDVLTESEARAIVDACVGAGAPALFSLSVTGQVELRPADARDAAIAEAFNAHQQRAVVDRILLGPTAPGLVAALFERAGWRVEQTRTTWRLDARAPRLLAEWFDGWTDAAAEQSAVVREQAEEYRRRRIAQMRRGELSAVVAHADLLARPR